MIHLQEYEETLKLNKLTNKELQHQLYKEILYYTEDLDILCHIIMKQFPRKMIYRLISKLYRLRKN